jgi:hypothetical protein
VISLKRFLGFHNHRPQPLRPSRLSATPGAYSHLALQRGNGNKWGLFFDLKAPQHRIAERITSPSLMNGVQATRDKFLLIVCKVINPFVDLPLLKVSQSHLLPVDDAANIEIAGSFRKIREADKKNGTHNVGFIVNQILLGVQDLGFSTSLSAGALVTGQMATIGDIVDELASGAAPI